MDHGMSFCQLQQLRTDYILYSTTNILYRFYVYYKVIILAMCRITNSILIPLCLFFVGTKNIKSDAESKFVLSTINSKHKRKHRKF